MSHLAVELLLDMNVTPAGFASCGTSKDIIGAWIQFLAVIVAVVAGIVATVQNYRSRTSV
jgi:hypothetical protein